MTSVKKTLIVVITSLGLTFGALVMAHAGPGGSLKGSATISHNEAQDVYAKAGYSADAKVLGIFGGGGGKGTREADTLVQGVNVFGTEVDADIAILDNKASKITNDGARLNVQGISVNDNAVDLGHPRCPRSATEGGHGCTVQCSEQSSASSWPCCPPAQTRSTPCFRTI